MNCRDFREQYSRLIDLKQTDHLPGEMVGHLNSCRGCSMHVEAMLQVDAALRNADAVPFPPGLERRLLAIPTKGERARPFGDLIRPALLVSVAVLLTAAGLNSTPELTLLIETVVVTTAVVVWLGSAGLIIRPAR
jgi:hypothetical protein